MENNFKNILYVCLNNLKATIKIKAVGWFIAIVSLILMIIDLIVYNFVPEEIYNYSVIIFLLIGVLLFIVLSLFKETSSLAPIALMIFSFIAFKGLIDAEGTIDYFTTFFYDGFSFSKAFTLPFPVWFSILSIVLSFIISSVSVFMPQNKSNKKIEVEKDTVV